ncbi:hypothetical protein LMH87_000637 [Akanthomyces muscarius]|uniref:Uncharacterized protein n=1 Tax=Akanthomyces muscarius TaxID=2231603 RepID=A0A9W8UNU7_AKAMU|nr:hypothetical protein LMH87_000637 [Akanthomyces muscarius]KAJ4155389.1 hypothetical protein LMH87_000637 [Akanthomyces muscarius]
MSVNELLGSDNQARLKELAKDTLSAESTLKSLASEDPSSRRDAALIVFDRACNKPPTLENTTLVDALAETLKPPLPRAQESIDALAWATSAEAALAALWSLDAEVDQIHDALLLCVIPYAKARKPWVTMTAASTAERLLDRYRPGEKKQDFIITGVLERYLRPIFSKRPLGRTPGRTLSPSLTGPSKRPSLLR